MIQRKQTLFLFLAAFFNVTLLFVPNTTVTVNNLKESIVLEPILNKALSSTAGHTTAIFLNFGILVLSFLTAFLYKNRELQIKLCYLAASLFIVLGGMLAFCHFVVKSETISLIELNYLATTLSLGGFAAQLLAARFIKKDIELLKSADRIR